MYYCEICGRECNKKIRYGGYTLCSKHMHQIQQHGKFLDSNPRSTKDPNEFRVEGEIAYIDLYNQKSIKVGEFMIDAEDLEIIRNYRWRLSYGRAITGNHTKTHPTREVGHILFNVTPNFANVIDHIDGNPLNNRKNNLRICTQRENTLNKSKMSLNTSGIIGVCPDKRKERKKHWCAEIRKDSIKIFLGSYVLLEEAAYARHIGEVLLFGEFRNTNNDNKKEELFKLIPSTRKKTIEEYVKKRVQKKCVLLTLNSTEA